MICYAYLWWREFEQGQDEGAKDRPCVIVLSATKSNGETVVTVVPITLALPEDPGVAIGIPAATKVRLGLDDDRSWVLVGETNSFVWPGPDLRPIDRERPGEFAYGILPPSFFRQVRDKLVTVYEARRHKDVARTE